MTDPLIEAAVRRRVGIAALRRIHALLGAEAAERQRILTFTRVAGYAAAALVLLTTLAVFGARL